MGIRWQYLAEGDKFRWYRLVSKETMGQIESDLQTLSDLNDYLKRGVPLLAPWKLITVRVDRMKVRNALREHLQKYADFHRDMMANTEYPRLAGEEEKGNYSAYPEYQKVLETRARIEAALGTKKSPKARQAKAGAQPPPGRTYQARPPAQKPKAASPPTPTVEPAAQQPKQTPKKAFKEPKKQ